MARLSTYAIDGTPVSSDKLIGTDSSGSVTKNYPLGDVADWLKSSGATAVLGQNNYLFQVALDPEEGRKIGSFSFDRYGGDGTEFSAVTELKFSASSSTGQYIADYLLSTVGQKVLISQLDAPNNFGIYALVSLTQSSLEPTFYDAVLAFVDGNGTLQGNESYGLATYSALNAAGGGTWGSITGDIDNQTDLVNYIDNAIAGVPTPPTPTLQSVTDEGNTTTNIIKTDAGFEAYRVGARRVFLGGTSINGQLLLDSGGTWDVNLTGGGNKYFANGNFGIGTTSPQQKLHVGGVLMAQNIGGSYERSIGLFPGNYEQTLKYSGTGLIIQNSSNDNDLGAGGGNVVVKLSPYATNDRTTTLSLGNKNQQNLVHTSANGLLTINNATSGDVMAIDLNGKVGIGTTTPSALLEIASNSTNDFIKLTTTGGGATPVKLIFEKTAVEQGVIEFNRNGDFEIYNTDNDGGVLISGSGSATADMYINHSGNVGIGTTTPVTPLHIGDGGTVTLESSSTTDGKLAFKAANGSEHAFLRRTGSYNLEIYSYGSIKLDSGTSSISFANNGKPVYWNVYNNSNFIFSGYTGFGGEVIMNNRADGTEVFHAYLSGTYKTTFPNGNVGIGTTAPSSLLHIARTTNGEVLRLQDTSNVNQNYVFETEALGSYYGLNLKNGNTGDTIVNFSANGKLGIKTNNPDKAITINETAENDVQIKIGNHFGIGYYQGGQTRSVIGSTYGNDAAMMSFTLGGYTTASDKMTILGSGNVGIGTTAPTEKLEVVGGNILLDTNTWIGSGGGSGQPRLRFDNTNSQGKLQQADLVLNDEKSIAWSNTGTSIQGRGVDSQRIEFNVASSERMRITSDGNVGIGTTTPTDNLEVVGAIRAGDVKINTGSRFFRFSGNTISILSSSETSVTGAATNVAVGRLGLGSTYSSIDIGAHNKTNSGYLSAIWSTTGKDALRVYNTSNSQTLTIKEDGNVGIGTTAPAEKLEVAGNIKSTSNVLVGLYNKLGWGDGNNYLKFSGGFLNIGYFNDAFKFDLNSSTTKSIEMVSDSDFQILGKLNKNILLTTQGTGNVGIGTASPDRNLEIAAQDGAYLRLSSKNTNTSTGALVGSLEYKSSDSDDPRVVSSINSIVKDVYGRSADLIFSTAQTNQSNAERMRITDTGNVGIGTTAPAAKLHVVGTNSIIDNQLKLGNRTGQNGKLILQGNNGPNFTIEGVNDVLHYNLSTGNPNGGLIQFNNPIRSILFNHSVGGRFWVRYANTANTDNNGGGLFIESQTTAGSNGRAVYVSADTNGGIIRSTSYGSLGTTGLLQFQVGGNTSNASNPLPNTKMVLDASGNVGIGTTAPTAKLDVQESTLGDDILNVGYTSNLSTYQGSGTVLKATSSYNANWNAYLPKIGIGTETPEHVLDIRQKGPFESILNVQGTHAQDALLRLESYYGLVELRNQGDLRVRPKNGRGGDFLIRTGLEGQTGWSAKFIVTNAGNVGIGTTAPSEKLHVVGNTKVDGTLSVVNTQISDINGQVYIDNLTNGGDLFIRTRDDQGGGDIGILLNGTDKTVSLHYNTIAKLITASDGVSVIGNINLGAGSYLKSSTRTNILLDRPTDARMVFNTLYQSSTTGGYEFTTGSTSRMVIAGDGNVGIGTTAPAAKLHVEGGGIFRTNTGSTPLYITRNGATTESLAIYTNDSGTTFETFQDETAAGYGSVAFKLDNGAPNTGFDINHGTSPMFRVSKDNESYIVNSGNFGIGTTNPSYPLHVYGTNAEATTTPTSNGQYAGFSTEYGGEHRMFAGYIGTAAQHGTSVATYFGSPAGYKVQIGRGGSTSITIDTSNRVGINTSTPAEALQVNGTVSADGYKIYNNSTALSASSTSLLEINKGSFGRVGIFAGGSELLTATSAGKVGISATSPTSKLHVNAAAMEQFRIETPGGPTGSGDTKGNVGDIAYDADYFYIKTDNGWGRVPLDFGF